MKTEEEIKKGLECCSSGNGCQYETVKDCPYRITNASCDRAGLIADALQLVIDFEKEIDRSHEELKEKTEKINKAVEALGIDCDNCDRW